MDGRTSPGGVKYRAAYAASKPFEMDIALWCYKWIGWDGSLGRVRYGAPSGAKDKYKISPSGANDK